MERGPEAGSAGVQLSEAEDPLVLAIDAGTSSVRALAFDARGRMVRTLEDHRRYAVSATPDGGVTADAEALTRLVGECVDTVLHGLEAAGRKVAAVATDTFWHSLLGVDARGKALTPIYTWADTRSAGAARKLQEQLDPAAVHARTGAALHSSYLPAKLLWLQQTQPALAASVAYWMSFGEYLYLNLFGERRVSLSMASATGLFDQNDCAWDGALLDVLPVHVDQLSPLAEFSETMTGLRKPHSGRWPALRTVPWYLPLGDGATNNVGSGGFYDQWIVAMIGTSGAIRVVREVERVDIPEGLWTYRVDRRRFVQGGALSDGGNVFAWLEHSLRLQPIAELEDQLARMTPDAHGLTVLPFLAGERSPHWNAQARAAFVGMRLDTRPVDIVRASMEAIAYRFGIIYEIMQRLLPGTRGIIGSGAGLIHSPAWLQIMTDVLGEPVYVSAVPEASSRGAALLVLEALGALKSLGDAPAPLGHRYTPVPERTEIYRQAMARQERLYRLLIGTAEGDS